MSRELTEDELFILLRHKINDKYTYVADQFVFYDRDKQKQYGELIIRDKEGKYYTSDYTSYFDGYNFNTDIKEVSPIEVTKTIYVKK
jgi:hypothetical protein